MQILVHEYTRYAAVACVLMSLFLILRPLTTSPVTGRRRFGWKSFMFQIATVCLIVGIRHVSGKQLELAYGQVANVNMAITAEDSEYRSAKASFQTDFEAYTIGLEGMKPGGGIRNDLAAIGQMAGRTRAMGESLLAKYDALQTLSRKYQSTLVDAQVQYTFAESSLRTFATEEDAMLETSHLMRMFADQEKYSELSVAYGDFAKVFEKLSSVSEDRFDEIEVSLPALAEAMDYVKAANRYLATVEMHAQAFSNFTSPDEILRDVEVYQKGVDGVMESIHDLVDQLESLELTGTQAAI
jgi:hypothetical protein